MEKLKDFFGRKVGPFPLGVWLAGGVAGLMIGRRILASRASSPPVDLSGVEPRGPLSPYPLPDPGVGPPPTPPLTNLPTPSPCPPGAHPIGGPKCPSGTIGVRIPGTNCFRCQTAASPCPPGSRPIGGPPCPAGTTGVRRPGTNCYECKPNVTPRTAVAARLAGPAREQEVVAARSAFRSPGVRIVG